MVDRSSTSILEIFSRVMVVCFSEVKLDSFDVSLVSVVEITEVIVLFFDCFSEIIIDGYVILLFLLVVSFCSW